LKVKDKVLEQSALIDIPQEWKLDKKKQKRSPFLQIKRLSSSKILDFMGNQGPKVTFQNIIESSINGLIVSDLLGRIYELNQWQKRYWYKKRRFDKLMYRRHFEL